MSDNLPEVSNDVVFGLAPLVAAVSNIEDHEAESWTYRLPELAAGRCEDCPELLRREILATELEIDDKSAPAAVAIRGTAELLRINCNNQGPTFRHGCSSKVYERKRADQQMTLILEQAYANDPDLASHDDLVQKTADRLMVVDNNADNFLCAKRDLAALGTSTFEPSFQRMYGSNLSQMDLTARAELRETVSRGVDIMRALTRESMVGMVYSSDPAPLVNLLRLGGIRWYRFNRSTLDGHNGFDTVPTYEEPTDVLKMVGAYRPEPKNKDVHFTLTTQKGRLFEILTALVARPDGMAVLFDFVQSKINQARKSYEVIKADERSAARALGVLSVTTEVRYLPRGN